MEPNPRPILIVFIEKTDPCGEICDIEILLPNENENSLCHSLLFGSDFDPNSIDLLKNKRCKELQQTIP